MDPSLAMMWCMFQMQQQAALEWQNQAAMAAHAPQALNQVPEVIGSPRAQHGTKRKIEAGSGSECADSHHTKAREEHRSLTPEYPSPSNQDVNDANSPLHPRSSQQSVEATEAPTPEMLRRLLSITAEENPGMTKEKAVARLNELAQEAQLRLQGASSSQSHHGVPTPVSPLGSPHFGPDQACEAKKAIQQFLKEVQEINRGSSSSQRDPQLMVRFVHPIESVEVLRAKIAKFHGAAGPLVEVAPADDSQAWKKPTASIWFAERKGDARKCVFRLNIPAEDSQGGRAKPKSMSLQVLVGGRELSVTAFKSIMGKYGGNLIMIFGPHRSIQINQTTAVGLDLTKFWGNWPCIDRWQAKAFARLVSF